MEHELPKVGEGRSSDQSRKLAGVGGQQLTYHFGSPPNVTPTPFWTVHRTSVRDEANMELLYVSVTISTGLSLEIPDSVADRGMLNQLRGAFQSDVQYKVKIPIICNVNHVQRGDVLKLFVPDASLVAPLPAAHSGTTASAVERIVTPFVAVPQVLAKAQIAVKAKAGRGKGKQ